MAKVILTESILEDIADAIRAKAGGSATIKPTQMAQAIEDIVTGITPTGTLSITSNGTHDVTNYASANVQVAGGPALLNTTNIGTVNTTSTQAASLNINCSVSGINNYDCLIVETSVNSLTASRHCATIALVFLTGSSTVGTKNGGTIATAKLNIKCGSSVNTKTSSTSTTAYGIYPNSVSVSNGTATLAMYRRYNSTSTGTINGTYTTRVYGVNLVDLIGG